MKIIYKVNKIYSDEHLAGLMSIEFVSLFGFLISFLGGINYFLLLVLVWNSLEWIVGLVVRHKKFNDKVFEKT